MARPKSEDKRNAILDAATRLFAERGLTAAPTSEISKQAGIAEGTLFTYFKTKDDLINALYREIKLELADAMMSDFPRKKNVRTRVRHVWDRYVNWGIANAKQRKVLAQLTVSEVLTKESRDAGSAPFVEFQAMIRHAIEQRVFRNDLPVELISKSLLFRFGSIRNREIYRCLDQGCYGRPEHLKAAIPGTAAPTSEISKQAGIAEGTLFNQVTNRCIS